MPKRELKKREHDYWNEHYYKGQFKKGKYDGKGEYINTQFNYIGNFVEDKK